MPRAAHVRGDLFRRMIVSGRQDYDGDAGGEGESRLRLRYRLSAATADAYAQAGFTTVVQDVVLGEELAAREAGRGKTGYGAHWSVAELDRVLRAGTPRIGLWLDTSELSVGETVEAILAGIVSGRERARVA